MIELYDCIVIKNPGIVGNIPNKYHGAHAELNNHSL